MSEKDSTNRVQVLSGNEACAMGALAADMRFYAGYPIPPSSEIAEVLSLELPKTAVSVSRWRMISLRWVRLSALRFAGSKSMTARVVQDFL
jgi:2-oxoglutarate ferredoxin oxidoreductase subunit alpha